MSRIPSAEQQAATAAKYTVVEKWTGTQAPPPQQIVIDQPASEDELENWRQKLTFSVLGFSVLLFVAGIVELLIYVATGHHNVGGDLIWGGEGLMFTGAMLFCVWALVAFWFCMIKLSFHIGQDAARPCPTPQEIEQQLRAQGHDPSVQDVMAIYQAKKTEQHENIGLAIGWFAMLQVIRHEAGRGRTKLG